MALFDKAAACRYLELDPKQEHDTTTVKAAFRRLALIHHPDKNGNSRESTERFQNIGRAARILLGQEEPESLNKTRLNPVRAQDMEAFFYAVFGMSLNRFMKEHGASHFEYRDGDVDDDEDEDDNDDGEYSYYSDSNDSVEYTVDMYHGKDGGLCTNCKKRAKLLHELDRRGLSIPKEVYHESDNGGPPYICTGCLERYIADYDAEKSDTMWYPQSLYHGVNGMLCQECAQKYREEKRGDERRQQERDREREVERQRKQKAHEEYVAREQAKQEELRRIRQQEEEINRRWRDNVANIEAVTHPMAQAIRSRDKVRLAALLRKPDANVCADLGFGNTALHVAAVANAHDAVFMLLGHVTSEGVLELRNEDDYTPMDVAPEGLQSAIHQWKQRHEEQKAEQAQKEELARRKREEEALLRKYASRAEAHAQKEAAKEAEAAAPAAEENGETAEEPKPTRKNKNKKQRPADDFLDEVDSIHKRRSTPPPPAQSKPAPAPAPAPAPRPVVAPVVAPVSETRAPVERSRDKKEYPSSSLREDVRQQRFRRAEPPQPVPTPEIAPTADFEAAKRRRNEDVWQLMSIGFSETDVRRALALKGSFDEALSYLVHPPVGAAAEYNSSLKPQAQQRTTIPAYNQQPAPAPAPARAPAPLPEDNMMELEKQKAAAPVVQEWAMPADPRTVAPAVKDVALPPVRDTHLPSLTLGDVIFAAAKKKKGKSGAPAAAVQPAAHVSEHVVPERAHYNSDSDEERAMDRRAENGAGRRARPRAHENENTAPVNGRQYEAKKIGPTPAVPAPAPVAPAPAAPTTQQPLPPATVLTPKPPVQQRQLFPAVQPPAPVVPTVVASLPALAQAPRTTPAPAPSAVDLTPGDRRARAAVPAEEHVPRPPKERREKKERKEREPRPPKRTQDVPAPIAAPLAAAPVASVPAPPIPPQTPPPPYELRESGRSRAQQRAAREGRREQQPLPIYKAPAQGPAPATAVASSPAQAPAQSAPVEVKAPSKRALARERRARAEAEAASLPAKTSPLPPIAPASAPVIPAPVAYSVPAPTPLEQSRPSAPVVQPTRVVAQSIPLPATATAGRQALPVFGKPLPTFGSRRENAPAPQTTLVPVTAAPIFSTAPAAAPAAATPVTFAPAPAPAPTSAASFFSTFGAKPYDPFNKQ